MAEEQTLACNRTPFATDDSCDRGDVDVTAFSEFPVCRLIDPTVPGTAVPQVDFPVIPFAPPPCACVDIAVVPVRKKIENRKDLYLNVDFRSIGDCCEGNYEADVDVRIPCIPFEIEGGSDSHDVDVGLTCHEESVGGTLSLNVGVESCKIKIDPQLHLVVPKPPRIYVTAHADVSPDKCGEDPYANLHVDVSSGDCETTFDIDLDIRFPHVANLVVCEGPNDIKFNEGLKKGKGIDASGQISLNTNEDSCNFATYICPDIKIDIPCPFDGEQDAKVTVKIDWDDDSTKKTGSATLVERKIGDCELALKQETVNIGLPCPFDTPNPSVTATIGWAENKSKASGDVADIDTANCMLTGKTANLDLGLPCPVSGASKINAKVKWGTSGQTTSGDLTTVNSAACTLTGNTVNLTLGLGLNIGGGHCIKIIKNQDTSSIKDFKIAYDCDDSESESGGGGESESGGGGNNTFTAVTNVECSVGGGFTVTSSKWKVDFKKKIVKYEGEVNGTTAEARAVARDILVSAVRAINDDPALLSVIDDPASPEAQKALDRLISGDNSHTSVNGPLGMSDDLRLSDFSSSMSSDRASPDDARIEDFT